MLQRSIARWITKAIAAGSHRTGFTTLLTPGRCIRALPHVITLATRMRGLVRSLRTHDPTPYSEALERLLETALDAATQLQASSEGLDQVERNLQAIATIFQ